MKHRETDMPNATRKDRRKEVAWGAGVLRFYCSFSVVLVCCSLLWSLFSFCLLFCFFIFFVFEFILLNCAC